MAKVPMADAIKGLEKQSAQLQAAISQLAGVNGLVKLRHELLEWWCLPDRQQLTESVALYARASQHLLHSPPPLRAPPPTSPLHRSQHVSFEALPHPRHWDSEWLARCKALTVGDIHDLMLDMCRRCATLLVPAQLWGPESPPHNQIVAMIHKEAAVSLHLCMINPEAWLGRINYNMETGERVPTPTPEWWGRLVAALQLSHQSLEKCYVAEHRFRERAQQLAQELELLKQRLSALMQGRASSDASITSLCPASTAAFPHLTHPAATASSSHTAVSTPHGSSSSGPPTLRTAAFGVGAGRYEDAGVPLGAGTLEEVVSGLQRVMDRQRLTQQERVHYLTCHALTPMEYMKVLLGTYPFSLPVLHMGMDAILGVAANQIPLLASAAYTKTAAELVPPALLPPPPAPTQTAAPLLPQPQRAPHLMGAAVSHTVSPSLQQQPAAAGTSEAAGLQAAAAASSKGSRKSRSRKTGSSVGGSTAAGNAGDGAAASAAAASGRSGGGVAGSRGAAVGQGSGGLALGSNAAASQATAQHLLGSSHAGGSSSMQQPGGPR